MSAVDPTAPPVDENKIIAWWLKTDTISFAAVAGQKDKASGRIAADSWSE
jgi:hypothetical protein